MTLFPQERTRLNDHLSYELIENNAIVEFEVSRTDDDTINLWGDKFCETMENWPADKPYLSLHNFLAMPGFMTTPLIRHRSREATRVRSDLDTRTAILMSNRTAANIINILVRALPGQRYKKRERKVFLDRHEAIAWLLEWNQT